MSSQSQQLKILFQENPFLLAPMAGVCDVTFRSICKDLGAGLTYTEMVSAKGMSYGNQKTNQLLEVADNEPLVAVQLFGKEPEVLASQAQILEDMLGPRLGLIDVNMGCPVRKVAGKGEGAALMKDPQLAFSIIAAMTRVCQVPVTAKIRRGFELDETSCVDFALGLQEAGAAAVTVHGRTAAQMYSGKADWEAIAAVAQALEIPVIGNGDIVTPELALNRLKETLGLSGVMIARAARGNPFIFKGCQSLYQGLGNAAYEEPSLEEVLGIMRRHAQGLAQQDERAGAGSRLLRMRKFVSWYLHGVPNASLIRNKACSCRQLSDFMELFDTIPSIVAQVVADSSQDAEA